jgi:RNase P subunit RPR2
LQLKLLLLLEKGSLVVLLLQERGFARSARLHLIQQRAQLKLLLQVLKLLCSRCWLLCFLSAYVRVNIRQHTSAYVSIRQHTPGKF